MAIFLFTIEMSFSDMMKGIDPVYEWIKEQCR